MPPLSKLHVDVEHLEFDIPPETAALLNVGDDELWKEWAWENHRDAILMGMNVRVEPVLRREATASFGGGISSESSALDHSNHNTLSKFQQRLALLDKVAEVQRKYLRSEGPKVVYGCMLEGILDLTRSEYGFIGEVKHERREDGTPGTPYVQTHAATNIAWNEATQKFYEDNVEAGLKFYNMNTLFGTVVTTSEPVISNAPPTDSRAGGIPEGHPALDHFLGIPFFGDGGEIVGIVGIANKPGGYTESDVEFLEPFTATCSNLIQAYWQINENRQLIENLEEANRRVRKASENQLQHFACMSHEIRTPLNAVIGLSTMLAEETDLTPLQKESVQTIVASGGLLLNIVNDVLDFASLESGNLAISRQHKSLGETLSSFLSSIEKQCGTKKFTLKTFFDPDVPEFVTTDHHRLQQILYNLVGNAIKFSQEGGDVELHLDMGGGDGELQPEQLEEADGWYTVVLEEREERTASKRLSWQLSDGHVALQHRRPSQKWSEVNIPCSSSKSLPTHRHDNMQAEDDEGPDMSRYPFHRPENSSVSPSFPRLDDCVEPEPQPCPQPNILCNLRQRLSLVEGALRESQCPYHRRASASSAE